MIYKVGDQKVGHFLFYCKTFGITYLLCVYISKLNNYEIELMKATTWFLNQVYQVLKHTTIV